MSLLLADSGATKTTWARVEKDHQQIVITSGMNPNLKVDRELESVVYDELFAQLSKNELTHVYFYGAGTGEVNTAGRLEKILQEAFLNCEIHVGTDIEAAGLSTFGNESGVAAISGTGSGAAMMNNGKVEKANKRYMKALKLLIKSNKSKPNKADTLNYLGFTTRKLGDFETGEKYYLQGLAIEPNHIGINEYLGELYVATNRIDLANERLKILESCNCKEYDSLKQIIAGTKKSKY